ncbi:DUF2514 family protein [Kosakonia sp. 1610]|uniref:DUF2514 family protein n=1 Tax=Kosakonia sp. 1610 TaxID=3156426 RepID=UPI003D192952
MIRTAIIGIGLAAAFAAGCLYTGTVRDRAELTREVNAQTAARLIEQGRSIARDEAVKDAQNRLALAAAGAAALRDTVNQLRDQSGRLASQLDAAKRAGNSPAAAGGAATNSGAGVLADVLGSIAEEAASYAHIADERYSAGIACETIYSSVER